jgi:hypothetical protein
MEDRSLGVRAALIAFMRFRVELLGLAIAHQGASYSVRKASQNRLRFGNAITPQHRAPGSDCEGWPRLEAAWRIFSISLLAPPPPWLPSGGLQ